MSNDPMNVFLGVMGIVMVLLLTNIASCEGGRAQGWDRAMANTCTTKKLVCAHEVTVP